MNDNKSEKNLRLVDDQKDVSIFYFKTNNDQPYKIKDVRLKYNKLISFILLKFFLLISSL
jgi:hypothetical protein